MIERISSSTPRLPLLEEPTKQPVSSVHFGLHKIGDSISRSPSIEQRTFDTSRRSKPSLPSPFSVELQLIKVQEKREEIDRARTENGFQDLNELQKQRYHLDQERYEQMQKLAIEQAKADTWSKLSNIATMVAASSSLVLGISLISSGIGTPAGVSMLLAGSTTLLHSIMRDTNGYQTVASLWTKEQQREEKIAQFMESSVFFLSLGLGIFSFGSLYFSGGNALIQAVSHERTLSSILSGTGSLTKGITEFERGLSQKNVHITQEILQQGQKENLAMDHRQEHMAKELTKIWENNTLIFEIMYSILSQQQKSFEKRS
ncbi:MAG: hypothetical protein JW769_03285 [Parachlamydiales bacterium]|nr:hypothetical protein [Parachlamydiales bacterium]